MTLFDRRAMNHIKLAFCIRDRDGTVRSFIDNHSGAHSAVTRGDLPRNELRGDFLAGCENRFDELVS